MLIDTAPPAWKQHRERSSPWVIHLIVWIGMRLGRSISRLLLWPIALYFLLTGPVLRRTSRHFLQRVLPNPPHWRDTYRQIFMFAACALDRVFLLTNQFRRFQLRVVDHRGPLPADEGSRGAIIFTAHLGSFDVLRVLGSETKKRSIKVVMDRAQGRMITDIMSGLNPALADEIIDAAEGPALVLRLKEALDGGTLIGMMADRLTGAEPGVGVDFLGGRIDLPLAPWKLAVALGYPVQICFGIYEGGNRYTIYFEDFELGRNIPRAARSDHAMAAAQRFAQRLEHYARIAPYNWFNFFDFWPDDATRD